MTFLKLYCMFNSYYTIEFKDVYSILFSCPSSSNIYSSGLLNFSMEIQYRNIDICNILNY